MTPASLPTGTVTFLRTDVEGSMVLTAGLGDRWDEINDLHIAHIRRAVQEHGGVVVRVEGDAVFAAFPETGAAVAAAAEAQRALLAHPWPSDAPVRVRMGLHTGEAHLAGADYGGLDVSKVARIAAAGHGGQVLASGSVAMLAADRLPSGAALRDLGPHVLKDLPRPERLYQLDLPDAAVDFPPLRAPRPDPGDLPMRLTSFLGRDTEIEGLVRLARDARLITMTGPGGSGKSSLAIEVARRLAGDFREGAWFVPLASVTDPLAVEATIARAIGLFDGPERSAADALAGYLGGRSMLLVLDNFEQLLDAAGVVVGILRASPESTVLVTSRAPLRVAGEHEFPVPPLDGGRQLFIERGRAVRAGWSPSESEVEVVDQICALVDGLPLGIELAAARVALLPVGVIRDRLAARLPLPGSGPRDAPARQRTLEGTVAWSHDLLRPALRTVFHDLAVFEGGFDVAQAAEVIAPDREEQGDALDDLLELAEHSLLARDRPDGPEVRFRLLRTVADAALAKLRETGREDEVRRRHAEAYLALAQEALRHHGTSLQPAWMDRLAADDPQLRAAMRWSIDTGATTIALGFAGSLWRYWQTKGLLAEGRDLVQQALSLPGADEPSSARLWAVAAAGNIAYWQGEATAARESYLEQQRIARVIGDEEGEADAIFNLAHVEFLIDAGTDRLLAVAAQAEARYRDLGDERGVARARWAFPTLALAEGRPEQARDGLLALREEFERLGDSTYHAMTTASLGWVAFAAGDFATACRWSVEAVEETFRLGDVGTTTISLHVGVLMAVMVQRHADAARLTGAFDALTERYGVRPPAALGRFIAQTDPFAMARAGLSETGWADAYAAGRRMSLEEAIELVAEVGAIGASGLGGALPVGDLDPASS